MIVRIRSRDGLERVQVGEDATLGDLRAAAVSALGVPLEGLVLSADPKLLTSKDPEAFLDLDTDEDGRSLKSLGVTHGSILHAAYEGHGSREVAGPSRSRFERLPFGVHMDVAKLVAAQTRIERQEVAGVASASFDARALDAFQSYASAALGFHIKRAGILYGTVRDVEDDGPEADVARGRDGDSTTPTQASASASASAASAPPASTSAPSDPAPRAAPKRVFVHAILEPPQSGTPDSVSIERGSEDETRADALAAALGWQKVGWIFSQSTKEREFILSAEEAAQCAAWQAELGPHAVTALVVPASAEDDPDAPPGGEVHVEAFQVSAQLAELYSAGWLGEVDPTRGAGDLAALPAPTTEGAALAGSTRLVDPRDPKKALPVILAGKDASEVDDDYFLVPVPIRDHEGPLGTAFPTENRLLPRGLAELRSHLAARASQPLARQIADFHLLLFLAEQEAYGLAEAARVATAVAEGRSLDEGDRIIIEGIAHA